MFESRCVHGLDVRFCSICNTRGQDGSITPRPAVVPDSNLAEILRFLNEEQVRATYGAVGEVLGVVSRSLGAVLGHRRPEASWIVNAESGLPTGYDQAEWHPALFSKSPIIRTGSELAMRMSLWGRRQGTSV